jgi:hypothetical protein
MLTILPTLLTLINTAPVPPHCSAACVCTPGSVAGELDHSRAVFVGRVLSWGKPRPQFQSPLVDSLRPFIVVASFVVERSWKGVATDTLDVVITAVSDCAPHARRGDRLLVYAKDYAGTLVVPECTRTGLIASRQVQEDLRVLGPGARRGAT